MKGIQLIRECSCGARLLAVFGLLCIATGSQGQGTINITFNGPPPQPPGTGMVVQEYLEGGMCFTPIDPNAPFSGFIRLGGGVSFFPENGTAYLQADLAATLKFALLNGDAFDLVALDLAEYSTAFARPATVHFVGYRQDGSSITTDLTTDGIIDGTGPLQDFQTFNFQGFTGLTRVEIPTALWSLDNLVVSVPEPSSIALLLAGGVLVWAVRRRSK